MRAALLDTLALCLAGAGQPKDALAKLDLIDATGLSSSAQGDVACTSAMALAKAGDVRAALEARGKAVALGAHRRLLEAADGVITSRRLPRIEVDDAKGWAKLAFFYAPVMLLVALSGRGALQTASEIGVVVAIHVISLALHELAHVLGATAQGLKVLAVRFSGTQAVTRVVMPMGLPPWPAWVLAAPPVTAALAALGAFCLAASPSLGLTAPLVRLIALWLFVFNSLALAGTILPAQGKRKHDGDLLNASRRYRARRAWLLGLDTAEGKGTSQQQVASTETAECCVLPHRVSQARSAWIPRSGGEPGRV